MTEILLAILYFLDVTHSTWDPSSPNQGLNLRPLQTKGGVLTTGPPGSPRILSILSEKFGPRFLMGIPYVYRAHPHARSHEQDLSGEASAGTTQGCRIFSWLWRNSPCPSQSHPAPPSGTPNPLKYPPIKYFTVMVITDHLFSQLYLGPKTNTDQTYH